MIPYDDIQQQREIMSHERRACLACARHEPRSSRFRQRSLRFVRRSTIESISIATVKCAEHRQWCILLARIGTAKSWNNGKLGGQGDARARSRSRVLRAWKGVAQQGCDWNTNVIYPPREHGSVPRERSRPWSGEREVTYLCKREACEKLARSAASAPTADGENHGTHSTGGN